MNPINLNMNGSDIKNMETKQLVSFRTCGYLMGIDILKVREVTGINEITTVQNAPDFIRGLMNLRGQTITVIDPGVIFGLSAGKITPDSHNIIMKHLNLGIVVDSMGDIVTVPEYEIKPCPANTDKKIVEYLESVAKLNNEIMAILCPEKIIEKISVWNGDTEG